MKRSTAAAIALITLGSICASEHFKGCGANSRLSPRQTLETNVVMSSKHATERRFRAPLLGNYQNGRNEQKFNLYQNDLYFLQCAEMLGTFTTLNPNLASFEDYLSRLADIAELDLNSRREYAPNGLEGRLNIPGSKVKVDFRLEEDNYHLQIDLEEYAKPSYKGSGVSKFGFYAFYSNGIITELSGNIKIPWGLDSDDLNITGYNFGMNDGIITLEPLVTIRFEEFGDGFIETTDTMGAHDIPLYTNQAPYYKWLNKLLELKNKIR